MPRNSIQDDCHSGPERGRSRSDGCAIDAKQVKNRCVSTQWGRPVRIRGSTMPIHDGPESTSDTFHAFHTLWIAEMVGGVELRTLAAGLLRDGCAGGQPHADERSRAPRTPGFAGTPRPEAGGVTVVDAPPQVRLSLRPPDRRSRAARPAGSAMIVIRHISGHAVDDRDRDRLAVE